MPRKGRRREGEGNPSLNRPSTAPPTLAPHPPPRHETPADHVFRLLSRGKVHGSLARAGKVKSQTPKVEPQEKKKKVCGRAKKRLIYNRRFVNVRSLLPLLALPLSRLEQ